jgi:branched-chain amino acid transport system substrate-binding protein
LRDPAGAADVIGSYMTNSPDVAIFARQLRQLGMAIPWVGSTSIVTETAIRLAEEALWGAYGVSDFVVEANDESRRFAAAFRKKHGFEPDLYSAWCYGGMYLLKHAIETAGTTNPEAVRKAILGIRNLKGVEGTYNFNSNGDGVHGYNIVKNEKGKVVFIKHIEFDD